MDDLINEGKSLENSSRMMSNVLAQGSASLESLLSQRDRMNGVRKMMVNMAATLGVSNTTLRVIEKRENADRILVFLGMFITLIFIWFLYR